MAVYLWVWRALAGLGTGTKAGAEARIFGERNRSSQSVGPLGPEPGKNCKTAGNPERKFDENLMAMPVIRALVRGFLG